MNYNSLFFSFFFINKLIEISCKLIHRFPRQLSSTKSPYSTKYSENNHDFSISVTEAKSIACGFSELCQKVEEFKITENSSYNCYDKYLPIIFYSLTVNRSKLLSIGYLDQSGGHIHLHQSHSSFCKKIRRYLIFNLFRFVIFFKGSI